MIKNFFKRITGITAIEEATAKAIAVSEAAQLEASEKAAAAIKAAEEAMYSPKERATAKGEPWVAVLDTHVNKENVRNGFFELDWNEQFVLKLKQEGYGFDGDKDEEIVDRWFRELCANVVVDGDFGGAVNTGVIDINSVRKKNL
jgi:hypothetical protein